MTILALVEKTGSKRFRAVMTQPIALEAEGDSREEAIEQLRSLAQQRISRGEGELVEIDVSAGSQVHPWLRFAGMWKDNSQIDDYIRNITEYRREVDAQEPTS